MVVYYTVVFWSFASLPLCAGGLRLATHQSDTHKSNVSFEVQPWLTLFSIWQGEEKADFDQEVCPAPYDKAAGCTAYQDATATGSHAPVWQSYLTPGTQEKCCTPCEFPPPCSQYDSVFSSDRAKPYKYRASTAITAAETVLKKKPEYFPCCKGSMDQKKNSFEVAMEAVIDRLMKTIKTNPAEATLAWSFVYKGMIRNFAAASGKHILLDGGNQTLESIAQWMKADYLKFSASAKAMATKDSMSAEEVKQLRLKQAKVVFTALNLLVTTIHALAWNMGLWQTFIDNMLRNGPTGGCSLSIAELVWPDKSGRWASLASKDAAGCAFGLSVMLTVGVAQRTSALTSFKSFPIAGKTMAVGRAVKRMLFAETTTLYIDDDGILPLLNHSNESLLVKLPIPQKRREADFNNDYVYTLEAVNGTHIESLMYFSFVPRVGKEPAYLQCTWKPSPEVQEAMQVASNAAGDTHEITFQPRTKLEGADGRFDGLGDIAAGLSNTMGYDIGAIYFMWYVGYWQFYLLDATWRTGVSAWKLLQSEVENEELSKGSENLEHALKGEAVLAMLAAEAKRQSKAKAKAAGLLSWLSSLLPKFPTCAEGMVQRYVRVFAGLTAGRPQEFIPEACGLVEKRTPALILASDALGLLEAFFGIGPQHLEEKLDECDSDAGTLMERIEACGFLDLKANDFWGECCEDRYWIDTCVFDVLDIGTLADAFRHIRSFHEELCSVVS